MVIALLLLRGKTLATVYFSNGTTAEVENIRGEDRRTFTIADGKSLGAFMKAFNDGSKLAFIEGGEAYLITQIQGERVTVVAQISRAR